MLPFLLHCQKLLGVTGWHWLLHARERLPKFLACMCHQHLERTLVNHRDNTTLDSAAQQLTRQMLPQPIPAAAVKFPALRLGLDVREQLSQRFEFDEAQNGKGDRAAVFQNYCGRRNNCLKWNVFGSQGGPQDHCSESNADQQPRYGISFSWELVHATGSTIRPIIPPIFPSSNGATVTASRARPRTRAASAAATGISS